MAVLDALRDGTGAVALGLFDDDRADADPARQAAGLNLWQAFGALPCLELDFPKWYVQLRGAGKAEVACACGDGHTVHGTLIHDRWALVLVAPAVPRPGAAAIILSAVKALADKLPPAKPAAPAAEVPWVGDVSLTTASIPLWWVRKDRE